MPENVTLENEMLAAVKKRLRIKHQYIDDDINEAIGAAKKELIRNDVNQEMAEGESDELIRSAIITYCMSVFDPSESARKGYFESWQYQLDCIRKSPEYQAGDVDG